MLKTKRAEIKIFVNPSYIEAYVLFVSPIIWTILLLRATLLQSIIQISLVLLGSILLFLSYITIDSIIKYIIKAKKEINVEKHIIPQLMQQESSLIKLSIIITLLAISDAIFIVLLPYKAKIALLIALCMLFVVHIIYYVSYFKWILTALTFNAAIWVAWYSISEVLRMTPVIVYSASSLWTIGYMLVLGHSIGDNEQNNKILKNLVLISNAIGQNTETLVWSSYKLTLMLLYIAGFNSHLNIMFTLIYTSAIYILCNQISGIDIYDKEYCAKSFKSNISFASVILVAILIGLH